MSRGNDEGSIADRPELIPLAFFFVLILWALRTLEQVGIIAWHLKHLLTMWAFLPIRRLGSGAEFFLFIHFHGLNDNTRLRDSWHLQTYEIHASYVPCSRYSWHFRSAQRLHFEECPGRDKVEIEGDENKYLAVSFSSRESPYYI